jgi:hypothetical protein
LVNARGGISINARPEIGPDFAGTLIEMQKYFAISDSLIRRVFA